MQFPQLLSARLLLPFVLLVSGIETASAQSVRLLSADDRGVTLRVEVPAFEIPSAGSDGRSRLVVPGLDVASLPGRPELPFAAALIAVPQGSHPVARVVGSEGEETREGVRLSIGRQSGFRDDGGAIGVVPTLEEVPAIVDGAWPRGPVELETPVVLRRQRVAAVRLFPFRYDVATSRLSVVRALTVRVDFGVRATVETPAAEDGPWESVLRGTLLNYEQGRRWREAPKRDRVSPESLFPRTEGGNRPAALGGPAFDEGEPEVRVRVDTTGVHQIHFDFLSEKGYPTGVPIAEVSVHRHEFVQNATPSYVTLELPIEVVDADADGVFGSGDRIVLFVQNWAERSRATIAQRAWGDGEVVFATRVRRIGLRTTTRPGWRDLALTPLASYPHTQHWERNTGYLPVYQTVPAVTDSNTDQFLWVQTGSLVMIYARPDTFRFETNHLDTTQTVRFTVQWQGSRANNHFLWADLRNAAGQMTSVADAANYIGRGTFTHTVSLYGSALSEGNTNRMRSFGKNSLCDDITNAECLRVNAVVNWFEATYWRRYQALGGYLSCNSGGVSGDYEIRADGFATPDIRVYDVTDSLNPVRLTVDPSRITQVGSRWSVRFQDFADPGTTRRYIVCDFPKTVLPDVCSTVTRQNLSTRTEADYLLIVPEEFQPAVVDLAAFRAQQMTVLTAPLEAVNDEFNGGRRSSHAIKRFIRHGYRNWDSRFVLLVGDGSEDPQAFLTGASKDWLPAQKVAGPVGVHDGASYVNEAIVSDGWYAWCLDCANPATERKLPELFVGRLPANSLQQVADMVSKIVKYETVTPEQTWRRNMLLSADDIYSTTTFFGSSPSGDVRYCQRDYEVVFVQISQIVRDLILNAGLVQSNPEIFDLNVYLAGEPPDPNDSECRLSWPDTQQHTQLSVTPRLFEKLNEGRLWWNFQGHANPGVLTHEDLYKNDGNDPSSDNKFDLMNDDKPFLFSAFSCHPNTFGRVIEGDPGVGPSLGEDMVTWPRGGAIASWGSTGFEIMPSSPVRHLNVHFARALFAAVDTFRVGRWNGRVTLGEAAVKALIANWFSTSYSLEKDVAVSYVLLGDPATRFSIGSAQFRVTANGVPVTSGEPVRLYTFGDSLQIEADLASNTRIDSLALERSDGVTTQIIPASDYTITPAFPDTSRLTAGRRYHLSYRTTLDVGSFRYVLHTFDANDVPGRFEIVFSFISVLRADGIPLGALDAVSPTSTLSLLVVSPAPIADPTQAFAVELDGNPLAFTPTPAHGDTSRREWVLTLNPTQPYPPGEHRLDLSIGDEATVSFNFRVDASTRIERALAFPNPFDDEAGTHFSFNLVGDGTSDVQIRIYTVSGRLIYQRSEQGLLPGYHQLAWDGLDSERDKLANGVYVYRLMVRNPGGSAVHEGRLVKLRRPMRRVIEN